MKPLTERQLEILIELVEADGSRDYPAMQWKPLERLQGEGLVRYARFVPESLLQGPRPAFRVRLLEQGLELLREYAYSEPTIPVGLNRDFRERLAQRARRALERMYGEPVME